jgi:hypothetical protein
MGRATLHRAGSLLGYIAAPLEPRSIGWRIRTYTFFRKAFGGLTLLRRRTWSKRRDCPGEEFMWERLGANYKRRRWIVQLLHPNASPDVDQHPSRMNAESRNAWRKRERIADARSLD